jgi:hypothetical protein
MMNRRQRRAFKRQWDAQIEAERNGAPIPGDVAERMTKPKQQVLFQVMVTRKGRGDQLFACGPKMIKDACGLLCETINRTIIAGREKDYTSATVVPLNPISGVQ